MTTPRNVLLAAVLALGWAAPAQGAAPPPTLDVRASSPVTVPVRATTRAFERGLGPEGVVQIDRLTGTPRVIADLDGFLTGPRAGAPAAIVKRWARRHRQVLGLRAGDLAAPRLRLLRRDRAPDGSTTLIWAQTHRGIPSLDTTLRATVARNGALASIGGSPLPGLRAPVEPALTATGALRRAIATTGATLSVPRVLRSADGPRRATRFAGGHEARLILVNLGDEVRLGWQVWLEAAHDQIWDVIVDARDGRVLRRANRVLSAGRVRAWDHYPGAARGGEATDRDLARYFTAPDRLEGMYTHVFKDVEDDDTPQAGDEVRPDANGDWVRPFVPVPSPLGNCPAAGCSWNHLVPNSWQVNLDQNAQQVFYFINHFADHVKAAPIGFDADSGNFQADGGDAIEANTSDGAATAVVVPNPLTNALNANMFTPADGSPPRMQMYLFEPLPGIAPDFADVNGGDDASIIYHEFTHGLTNRLVIGGDGNGALLSPQAGAMGEAWSDFYAMDFLIRQGFLADTEAPGELRVGEYTDGGNDSIRTEPVDCTLGAPADACPRKGADEDVPGQGGYAYDAFGKIFGGPEVHADGEIWVQTLFDLRRALIARHGEQEGGRRILALVTGGLRLSPVEPSFLDMRNAILQSDTLAGGGDHDLIWSVFAKRGMGFDARAVDGFDEEPEAGFALPPAPGGPTGAVSGVLTDADSGRPLVGVPAGITAFFSGLPSDLGALSGANGRFTIGGVPAGPYGPVRVGGIGFEPKTLGAVAVGGNRVTEGLDAQLRRNWGMLEGGGEIYERTGKDIGCGPRLALDADPRTGFETYSDTSPVDPGPKSFIVRLPSRILVSRLVIDPSENCFSDATSALGGYKVEFSGDSVVWRTVSEGEFTPQQRRPNDIPIPAGMEQDVRYVRMTMKSPQGPLADPSGMTYRDYMDLTELSVYGTSQDTEAPEITLAVRRGGALRGPRARLRGAVRDESRVLRVRVGDEAVALDGRRTFAADVPVRRGRNRFTVEALDASQNLRTRRVVVRGDFRRPKLRGVRAVRIGGGRMEVRGRATDDTGIAVVRVGGRRVRPLGARFVRTLRARRSVEVVARDLVGRRAVRRVRLR